MIFGFIVKVIKAVIDGFASVCAFLLWTLGLWLPAVYSVLYLIVCAIAGIRLQGAAITVYIVGLVLTFCGSVALGVFRLNRRKRLKKRAEKSAPSLTRSVKKRDIISAPELVPAAETDRSYGVEPYSMQTYSESPQPEESVRQENTDRKENIVSAARNESGYSQASYKYEDFADLRRKYFGGDTAADNPPQGAVWSDGSRAPSVAPQNTGAEYADAEAYGRIADVQKGRTSDGGYTAPPYEQLEKRLMGDISDEQPMVFAMRKDPDVIVYEYSDRLKFYRKTKRGLVHISTEFKR